MTADQDQAKPEAAHPEPESALPTRPGFMRRHALALFAALLVALNLTALGALGFVLREREQGVDQSRQALMVQLAGLRERVGKLETQSGEAASADAALKERVGAVETKLAAAPASVAQGGPAPDQHLALDDLTKRIGAL